MKNFRFLVLIAIAVLTLTMSCKKTEEEPYCRDADGNDYKTIKIGNQEWMAENLRTTKYNSGEAIPNITDNTAWTTQTAGAYCLLNNDAATKATHGALYNWATLNDTRGIAPKGWHIPTQAEWQALVDYLGGATLAGGKMKQTGTTTWTTPNTAADNSSAFNALGGGYRLFDLGTFDKVGVNAYWWSKTTDPAVADDAFRCKLYNTDATVSIKASSKKYGMYIRCVKD